MAFTYREGRPEIRPNVYQRFTAIEPEEVISYDGRVALLFQADWGPLDEAVVLTDIEDVEKNFGESGNVEIIKQAFRGGATEVYCQRIAAPDMKTATGETLYDYEGQTGKILISAKYPGARNLSVQVRKNLRNPKRKDIVVSDNGEIIETTSFLGADGKDEVAAMLKALNNSKTLSGKFVKEAVLAQDDGSATDETIEPVFSMTEAEELPGEDLSSIEELQEVTVSYEVLENKSLKATVANLPEGYELTGRIWNESNQMISVIPGRIDLTTDKDSMTLTLSEKAPYMKYTLEVRVKKAGKYTTLKKKKVDFNVPNGDVVKFKVNWTFNNDKLVATYPALPTGYKTIPEIEIAYNGQKTEDFKPSKGAATTTIDFGGKYQIGTYSVKLSLKDNDEGNTTLISTYSFTTALDRQEIDSAPEELPGSSVQEVAAIYLEGGDNGTITVESYSDGFKKIGKYRVNTIAVDTTDSDVQILAQEFVNDQYENGKYSILVLGLDPELDIISGQEQALEIDDKYVVLVGNGYYDADGNHINGFLLAAQIAGMIAAYPTNQSITHKVVQNAVKLDESYSNEEYEDCLTNGLLMLSLDELDNIVVDAGINTLHTLVKGEIDEGWKKIKRAKTRNEIFLRVTRALVPCIGNIVNDSAGRAFAYDQVISVLDAMFDENKIADDYVVEETSEIVAPDTLCYDIRVYDYDMIEKYYLHYIFRYQQ